MGDLRPIRSASSRISLGDGVSLNCLEGAGDEPTTMFLHGYIDSSRSFEALIENWPGRTRTLRPDFRGHGDSAPATSYAIADFAGDIIELVQRVVSAPVNVVGHSMGSIVAQRVAARRPDLVRKLVLIGAGPTAYGHPGLNELRQEIASFDGSVPRSFVEAFQRSTVYAPVTEDVIGGYIAESLKVGLGAWRGALDGLLDEPASAPIRLEVPALVVWGEHDEVFGAGAQADLAKLLPQHRAIRYPDAGHAPHWEFPKRVAADIDGFLRA